MTNILKYTFPPLLAFMVVFPCFIVFGQVNVDNIKKASLYSGPKTEKKLNDLLRSDYYKYLSDYYLKKEEAGFMALERFDLALTRAIGDIRIVSEIKDTSQRQQLAIEAFNNWTAAFGRAQIKNMPKAD